MYCVVKRVVQIVFECSVGAKRMCQSVVRGWVQGMELS